MYTIDCLDLSKTNCIFAATSVTKALKYINETISADSTFINDNVILKNVTTSNANIMITACNETVLDSEVYIPIGSSLTIY